MTARAYLWYLDHPRLAPAGAAGRGGAGAGGRWRCARPRRPAAATNSMVLDWTGLRDTYGVPIGDYYLALASLPDQITAGAPDVGVESRHLDGVDVSRAWSR